MERKIPILIDTGADLSLVSRQLLVPNSSIQKTSQTARAANGSQIPISGSLENFIIKIGTMDIHVQRALITSSKLNHFLLGAPEIVRQPELIPQILDIKCSKEEASVSHKRSTQISVVQFSNNKLDSQAEEIKRKISGIFISEISPSKLCSINKHSINTGDHASIVKNNTESKCIWKIK
ncbi:hypothetical protein ENBRE01_2925 [Enteropsectra breve]|nr:hypothetical protein ENBRE01_2925 [Enteropsectra breve]